MIVDPLTYLPARFLVVGIASQPCYLKILTDLARGLNNAGTGILPSFTVATTLIIPRAYRSPNLDSGSSTPVVSLTTLVSSTLQQTLTIHRGGLVTEDATTTWHISS